MQIIDYFFAHRREAMDYLSEHLAIVHIMFQQYATLSKLGVLQHLPAKILLKTF